MNIADMNWEGDVHDTQSEAFMATESKPMPLGEVQLVAQVLLIYSRFISKYYHGICLHRLKKTMKTKRIANNKAPSKYHCTTLLLHQPKW